MPTNFPAALDNFSNPAASTSMAAGPRTHSDQHSDLNDALEAVQAKIGVNGGAAGEVSRAMQAKLRDIPMVADYGTLAQAKTAAGNKSVIDPNGIEYKDVFNQPLNIFGFSGETDWDGAKVFRSSSIGSHVGKTRMPVAIELRPDGSTSNGPTNADIGMGISVLKNNFSATSVRGELDAMYLVVRNGGTASDSSGILIDISHAGSGYQGAIETATTLYSGATQIKGVKCQIGVIDNVSPQYNGMYVGVLSGVLDTAYKADSAGGTNWLHLFRGFDQGIEKFNINRFGQVGLFDASGLKKTLRCSAGSFSVVNNADTVELLNLNDVGVLSVPNLRASAAAAGSAGSLTLGAGVSATATAGGGAALPGTVLGYLNAFSGTTAIKIPYYAN